MTRVPRAPRDVRGLIKLRSQIITTIELRRWLKMADRAREELPVNVFVSSGSGVVSFQVVQIEDLLEIDSETIETPPESLDSDLRYCLKGVSKLDNRLLLLLEEARAMELSA